MFHPTAHSPRRGDPGGAARRPQSGAPTVRLVHGGVQYREYLREEQRGQRWGPHRAFSSAVGWSGDASPAECSWTFTTGCQGTAQTENEADNGGAMSRHHKKDSGGAAAMMLHDISRQSPERMSRSNAEAAKDAKKASTP